MEETSNNIPGFADNSASECYQETNQNDAKQSNSIFAADNIQQKEKQTIQNIQTNDKKDASVEKINSKRRIDPDLTLLNELRLSIIQGNVDAIKSLIEEKGVFVDTVLRSGWTALMYACSRGQYDIVDYLLKQNADPNFHNDMFTPLMACCASRKDDDKSLLQCVILLLEKGAKVNDKERHHMTPIMFASQQGHALIIQKLIESGAEINRRDARGYTALGWASNYGFGQVVRFLLENGADPTMRTIDGQIAADLAFSNGYNEIGQILTKAYQKENPDGQNPFDSRNKSNCVRNITHFTELELFFVGIGRGDLLPLFYENELSYKDLFKLNEEELEKIGVIDPNDRKIILKEIVSLNKSRFKTTNIPEIKSNNVLSCTEAVMMMSNISKHLAYVGGVIVYLRQKIQTRPRILELSQQPFNVHSLIKETEQGIKNANHLYEELKFLALYLKKLQDNKYIPADVITEVSTSNKSTKWDFGSVSVYILGLTSFSLVFGSIWWKFPHLFVKYSVIFNIIKKIINR